MFGGPVEDEEWAVVRWVERRAHGIPAHENVRCRVEVGAPKGLAVRMPPGWGGPKVCERGLQAEKVGRWVRGGLAERGGEETAGQAESGTIYQLSWAAT